MNRKSIFYRMTSFVILLIVIQSIFLTGMMIVGGVLRQTENNAFQTFLDKVKNRNSYIQSQMKNNWTNMDIYIEQISKELSQSEDEEVFFSQISETLIAMLRSTETTGAYVILTGDSSSYPALYFRDYDPMLNDSSNKDLYMVYGNSRIANDLRIPLDQTWNSRFHSTKENQLFITKPLSKATISSQANLIGYWSIPFRLTPKDSEIITYSMPFYDSKDELRGIIGVEISLNHLTKLLPLTDLRPTDSLGYLLAYKESEEAMLYPVVMTGALQKRMIRADESFETEAVKEASEIYRIHNTNSNEGIFAVMQRLGVYNVNTPFENESWYLVGMLQENYLLSSVNQIKEILFVAFIASLVLGIVGGYLLSYGFTKPITRLVKQVKESDKYEALKLDKTGLREIDDLSDAMIASNREVLESTVRMSKIIGLSGFSVGAFEAKNEVKQVLVTDQLASILAYDEVAFRELVKNRDAFINLLYKRMSDPLIEEEDVFRIHDRFVRLKRVENESGIMGVAIDVTKEIEEKQRIRRERDYDPLTKIYNRKAVQENIERMLLKPKELKIAAFIMFDLDNLKSINDSYGHQWGDIYIQKAVKAMEHIDSKNGIIGRRSGDEFILFLFGYNKKEEILEVMDGFYEGLKEQPIQYPDGERKEITISGGLVWVDPMVFSYEEYMHHADELLYKAKFESKGTYQAEKI